MFWFVDKQTGEIIRKGTDCFLEMLNIFYLSMKTLPMLNMNTDLSIIEVK